LKTDKSTQAQACLASLEDNLHRLNLGTLVPPDDVDLITLLLSDGRQYKKPQARSMRCLKALFDAFFESIPSGALEDCTICGMQIHSGHITRALVSAGTQNQPGRGR